MFSWKDGGAWAGRNAYLHHPCFLPPEPTHLCRSSFPRARVVYSINYTVRFTERNSRFECNVLESCTCTRPNPALHHALAPHLPSFRTLFSLPHHRHHVVLLAARQHHGGPPSNPALGLGLASAPAQGPSSPDGLPILCFHRARPLLQRLRHPAPHHG